MLRHVAAFEARYQLRSPVFWVGAGMFFLLTFAAMTIDQVQVGSIGNVHKNSPFALFEMTSVMSVFAIFVVVSMVCGVVVRDDETNFAPLIRSTPLSKTAYLVGRFTGATAVAFLCVAAVPLAVWLGSLMPGMDPEKLGPNHLADYLVVLFGFALPSMLIVAATFFAVATVTRSMMWTYVVAVGFLVVYIATRVAFRDASHDVVGALADPFGRTAFAVATKYWTAAERNAHLPPMTGWLLANRLLWAGIGIAVFAVSARLFRFEARGATARESRRAAKKAAKAAAVPGAAARDAAALVDDPDYAAARALLPQMAPPPRRERLVVPAIPSATSATRRAQAWALARHDMAFVFRSPAFFVLLLIALVNASVSLWLAGEAYGTPAWPVTRLMVDALNQSYTLFPVIIAIFYSGELVWRDRERRLHEIVDATSAPDWAHLVPKVLALTLVLLSTALVGVLGAMVVQALKGWFRFDIGHYVAWFVWPMVATLVQVAALSVFVQVLVPQKFIGWGVMVAYLVASIALGQAGFEHNLYVFGGSPNVPLSDFGGMSRFWVGQAWFHLYWTAFALVLLVLAHALWRRGATFELRPRLKRLRAHLRGTPSRVLLVSLVVFVLSGAWIFYNTNVLETYRTSEDFERLQADYEKALLKYENVLQPRVADVVMDVQLYPRDVRAVTTGHFTLVNREAVPIDVVHLAWGDRTELSKVDLGAATVQQDWPRFHYRIYKLAAPMQPGESRTLSFTTTIEDRGFANQRPFTRIVENGTFLDNTELLPRLGVSRNGLLQERSKRRKYGLPPELRPAKLEDDAAKARNEFTHDADWVTSDITVGTDADQIPIAPGYVQSDEIREVGGERRHVVRYKSDAPIALFFSVQSARYAVQRQSMTLAGHPVDLAVYHQPGHEFNIERMMTSMRTSLALFSEKFSPYQFHQARIIEFPDYPPVFAQSFANTIPYSEDIGFLGRYNDPDKIDLATYVTAHEVGHQWWGHQLLPADKQGASMLVETFAQYAALLVMEKIYGRDQVRRFLKYDLDRYLRSRGGEVVEELPLARVEEQGYIHYRKGSLAMYWLKEVVGEDVVDRALRRLLQQYAFKGAPYPDTRDFLALLRQEAGPQHDALITDLFEKITLLDLKASNAVATKRADGKWTLAFDVDARKFYADGKGVETEAPMDELVELGVFTAEPGRHAFKASDVLVLDKRRVTTGKQRIEMVVDRQPTWCGIDPYNKRIDRNSDDNLVKVNGS